jgi:hypothetical protein
LYAVAQVELQEYVCDVRLHGGLARHADPFVRAQRGVSLADDETPAPRG